MKGIQFVSHGTMALETNFLFSIQVLQVCKGLNDSAVEGMRCAF